jgi:hypothetical protein
MPDKIIIPGDFDEWARHRWDDFVIGAEHSLYEWCMIYTDRHPRALGDDGTATAKMRNIRLELLGVRGSNKRDIDRKCNAVYQELADAIASGRLDARHVYLDDRPRELDPTLCVLDTAPVLAIARRRKDHGEYIARLLAAQIGEPVVHTRREAIKPDLRNAIKRAIKDQGEPGKTVQWQRFCDAETFLLYRFRAANWAGTTAGFDHR